jgi:hypothetical protein
VLTVSPLDLVIILLSAVALGAIALINRDRIAVWLAPQKQAAASLRDVAQKADEIFWQTLHQGEYEKIPQALEALTACS